MHKIVLVYASKNSVCIGGHVASLIRFDLDCRLVNLEFLLKELSNFVESIAWIDVCHHMSSQYWLAFPKRVHVKIVNLINDRQLQKELLSDFYRVTIVKMRHLLEPFH